ncbi:RNA-binding protein [Pediococcus ethanolidurans]|uniref:YlmH family RNA-binding protein n=1 Tax=Pediococcus ethanolidurans TaxID=319653 RepID=UPI002952AC62|nr:RNA-binding protein [Pediococcus ethanolidurans]MDV7719820.1 RNA-binding protein [Pediococcus ethanolidurans]
MDNIMQHFRPEEAPFVEEATGWIQEVRDQNRFVLTNFLNPRESFILKTLVNRLDDIKSQSFGGYLNAEMQRVIIFPDYFTPEQADFNITLVSIGYPVKFAKIHHRNVLGTLANMGVERDTFGDIISNGDEWQFFVKTEMAEFFLSQVSKIGNIKVRLAPKDLDEVIEPENDWESGSTTVASLRADAVIAEGFHLSRNHAKELLEERKVTLNWKLHQRPDFELVANDLLSVRGYGRIRLDSVEGMTKKNKIRILISVISSKKKK